MKPQIEIDIKVSLNANLRCTVTSPYLLLESSIDSNFVVYLRKEVEVLPQVRD